MSKANSTIKYQVFRGSGAMSWDNLLASAAGFANTLGSERIINICHSSDEGQGTVVVWFTEVVL